MRLLPRLSREARQRKRRLADTHRNRCHYHKLMLADGFTSHILWVGEHGRIQRYYTRDFKIPLGREVVEAS